MLKNVDPILGPDALYALCAMGHGDEVVICDAHYPADQAGRLSGYGKVIRMDGANSARAIRAVLSVLELDGFVAHPAERMMVDGQPDYLPHVQQEAQRELETAVQRPFHFASVPRSEFYERAKRAYAMIITGETRGWGCFILRKGLTVTADQPEAAGDAHIGQWRRS